MCAQHIALYFNAQLPSKCFQTIKVAIMMNAQHYANIFNHYSKYWDRVFSLILNLSKWIPLMSEFYKFPLFSLKTLFGVAIQSPHISTLQATDKQHPMIKWEHLFFTHDSTNSAYRKVSWFCLWWVLKCDFTVKNNFMFQFCSTVASKTAINHLSPLLPKSIHLFEFECKQNYNSAIKQENIYTTIISWCLLTI